jgi:hypothetical protein
MVRDEAQLYTIEGLTAGVIMLLTAFLVLGTTTVYMPGDVHIADMQMEQLGSDALAMMDTPDARGAESELARYVRTVNASGFDAAFTGHLADTTGATLGVNDIQYEAVVYHRKEATGEIRNFTLASSSGFGGHDHVGREPSVTVTRWVFIDYDPPLMWENYAGIPAVNRPDVGPNARKQMVLLEVLLWRG